MAMLKPEQCALVTRQAGLRQLPWGAVYATAEAALHAAAHAPWLAVFADFGPLPEDFSGSRFTRALLVQCPHLSVYLLSDFPDLHRPLGRACGAADVVQAELEGLAQVLEMA